MWNSIVSILVKKVGDHMLFEIFSSSSSKSINKNIRATNYYFKIIIEAHGLCSKKVLLI